MKRLLLISLILLSLLPAIYVENHFGSLTSTSTNCYVRQEAESLALEVKAAPVVTGSVMTWTAKGIAGYSSIDFYGATGSVTVNTTTINCQPTFADGTVIGDAQTLTSGTDLTDLRSNYYTFTWYTQAEASGTVTLNFLIAD